MIAAENQTRSERMKSELITNISHDIKTPLTSIINFVDLLQKSPSEQDQEAYLQVLSRQSARMKKLIEDLVELSKANSGNITAHIVTLDAAESVNQALGEFSDKFAASQLEPVFQIPPTPISILADGRLVWRVLSNLMSNAVKYALPGTRLYIELTETENEAQLSLKNISREPLRISAEDLMERFVRGDVSRNSEGSGLGLNIAKSLMEIQNGQLQLQLDADLFTVTLVFPKAF
jgi:signal transduction histidine kinase